MTAHIHLSVYVSYARTDAQDFVRELIDALAVRAPWLYVWHGDDESADEPVTRTVRRRLASADAILVVRTAGYPDDAQRRAELDYAVAHENDVVVVHVGPSEHFDGTDIEDVLRRMPRRSRRPTALASPGPGSEEDRRSAAQDSDVQLINEMPAIPETEFHDRDREFTRLDTLLSTAAVRLVVVRGDVGTGKTALIRRLRQRLGRRDAELRTRVDGVIYLSGTGYRPVTTGAVLTCLSCLVRNHDERVRLRERLWRPAPWQEKLEAVVGAIRGRSAVILIDDADEIMSNNEFRTPHLHAFVDAFINRNDHQVSIVLVGTRSLEALRRRYGDAADLCELDGGLRPSDTYGFLTELGPPAALGLTGPDCEEVEYLYVCSGGVPRTLELAAAAVYSGAVSNLRALVSAVTAEDRIPSAFAEALLLRIVSRLDLDRKRVLQALAAFGRPVPAEAVDRVLHGFGMDGGSVLLLAEMESWRLVRRDHDHYFLPGPEAELVCEGIPRGRDDDFMLEPLPLSLPVLRSRGATYFADNRKETPTALEDLQAHFDEIAMRIRCGQYPLALELIAELDSTYLERWGLSDALVPWLVEVRDNLVDPRQEAVSASILDDVRSRQESEPSRDAEARLEMIKKQPWLEHSGQDRIDLDRQIADLIAADGRLTLAVEKLLAVAAACRREGRNATEVAARGNAALHLARTGHFPEAIKQHRLATAVADRMSGDDPMLRDLRAWLPLNLGWMYGQMGQWDDALTLLADGERRAAARRNDVTRARYFDSMAGILCDTRRHDEAVEPAVAAAEIATRSGNPTLTREANVTLAVAYLLTKQLDEAEAAVRAALRQPLNWRALGACTIRAVVAYRTTGKAAAAAFNAALIEAQPRLGWEPRDYLALDMYGLALLGSALCTGRTDHLARACDAFADSRRVTDEDGARRHRLVTLDHFGDGADPAMVDAVRRVIEGSGG